MAQEQQILLLAAPPPPPPPSPSSHPLPRHSRRQQQEYVAEYCLDSHLHLTYSPSNLHPTPVLATLSVLSASDASSSPSPIRMNAATLASTTSHCSPFSSPASSRPPSDPHLALLELDGSAINLKQHDTRYSLPYDHYHIPASKPELSTIPKPNPFRLVRPDSPDFLGPTDLGLGYRDSLGCLDKLEPSPVHHFCPAERPQGSDSTSSMGSPQQQTISRPNYPTHIAQDSGWDEEDDLAFAAEPSPSTYPDMSRSSGIYGAEGPGAYDLKAPPPTLQASNVEVLSERLFSLDHLKVILRDGAFYSQFSAFLGRFQPHSMQALYRYLELQKALGAIDYANAIAEALVPGSTAAVLSEHFMLSAREVLEELVNDALPKYITHKLVLVSTDILVKEITKQNTPVMRELVAGLAEVYCMTDPSLPDNPIVYASEEFFRYTQYSRDYAIGRNCRFLQGPKSSGPCVQRLVDALSSGTEICELILNYRRDGSPFLNLLMIAPLYDNKGNIRYFIGAQIDATGLVAEGKGLDSFERLLANDKSENDQENLTDQVSDPRKALGDLSQLFDEEDAHTVKKGMEKRRQPDSSTLPAIGAENNTTGRKFVGMNLEDAMDRTLWPATHLGTSGRLPGVFQNYLLVRPYPSLRITFTSPALRIPGMPQSKFVDRIGGSVRVRDEIVNALADGTSVTARINWLPQGGASESPSTDSQNSTRRISATANLGRDAYVNSRAPKVAGADSAVVGPDGQPGKPRWIHCTPLLGSDGKVGVWMIVLVESEFVSGALNSSDRTIHAPSGSISSLSKPLSEFAPSAKPSSDGAKALSKPAPALTRWSVSRALKHVGRGERLRGGKLYQDYLKREGCQDSTAPPNSSDGAGNEMIQQAMESAQKNEPMQDGSRTAPRHSQDPQPQQHNQAEVDEQVTTPVDTCKDVPEREKPSTPRERQESEGLMAADEVFRDF